MSYNIDTWKTKKIENLVIPMKAFYPEDKKNWHPYEPIITDTMDGVDLKVDGIRNYGEGSGSFMRYILSNALKQSKGKLVVVCVWEGGDTITKTTYVDGIGDEVAIDL